MIRPCIFSLLIFLMFMNCSSTKTIDIQGHRGCRGLLPENTIQGFEKAIELGVHTLELDVVVSEDKVVVVSHEPYMNPEICKDEEGREISKADGLRHNLFKMTFDSIKKFDCGTKFHPRFPEQEKIMANKPSLDEVIKVSKKLQPNIKFNIELKARPEFYDLFTPNPTEFVELVLKVVKENDAFDETNLQSFDLGILEEIRAQSLEMKVALLVDENETILEKLSKLSYKPEIISPYYKLISKEIVSYYHNKDHLVIPWTVNTVEDMKQMIDFQVDGIITDYPDRLLELLKE